MVEQIRAQELTTQEQKHDCGYGCGGGSCGTTQQELILVNSAKVAEMKQQVASTACGCGCDGSCGCWSE